MAVLKATVQQLHGDAYGNGQPGLFGQFRRFMHLYEGGEEERAKQHRSNTLRLNVIMALTALAALILTAIGILVTVSLARHSSLDFPQFFRRQNQSQEYTLVDSSPQTANE